TEELAGEHRLFGNKEGTTFVAPPYFFIYCFT
ncbi:DUF1905 domain-containing protein, partial [Enterococcus faecium]